MTVLVAVKRFGDVVNGVLDPGNPAPPHDVHHALLEQSLPTPGLDDRGDLSVLINGGSSF